LTRTLGSVRGAAGNGGPYRDPVGCLFWWLGVAKVRVGVLSAGWAIVLLCQSVVVPFT
jgi:hypothetical protein